MRKSIGLTALIGVALCVAPNVEAANLTGVWAGEQHCQRYNGEQLESNYKDDTMVVTQHGADINVASLLFEGNFLLVYHGRIDTSKEANTAAVELTECATSPESKYHEFVRADRIEVKKGNDADFEATSNFFRLSDDETPGETGNCTWKYRRVSKTDPQVPSCSMLPEPTQIPPGAKWLGRGPARP